MWAIFVAALVFSDMRENGWLSLLPPALVGLVLLLWYLLIGIFRRLDSKW
jgi:hypothetical protein